MKFQTDESMGNMNFLKIENHPGIFYRIKKELSLELAPLLNLKAQDIEKLLEKPKEETLGHLALPVFSYCRDFKKSPVSLSSEWLAKIKKEKLEFIEEIEAISGFINFRFCSFFLQKKLIQLFANSDQTKMSSFPFGKNQKWVVDFASPNVAKNMNVGHLRAGLIGQVIVNLARHFGFQVTAINHLGDWGTQFGKLLWAYKKWHKDSDFKNQNLSVDTLANLYVRFHKEETSESLREAAELFYRMEKGDKELLFLWKKIVHLSLKEYEFYWKKINIKHDLILGESFYRDLLPDLKTRLKEKNLLQKSQGAEVVFLNEEEPPCLIEKSDGASTYGARDLCSAIYRHENLKADRLIYITGSEQKLHFRQIFKTLEKMGFPLPCLHLTFGMYRFKGQGKLSTRKGQTVYLKDVLKESFLRVEKIIENRNLLLKDKKLIAEQVGTGAVIFHDLMTDRSKDVDFEWERVLDFDGRSGPFVQYTHVRCMSLLKKYGRQTPKTFSEDSLSEEEKKLTWWLLYFEEAVYQSFVKFKPHILAGYLLDLSKEFNRFYASEKILNSKGEQNKILLTDMTRKSLKTGLSLLNMPLPEAM